MKLSILPFLVMAVFCFSVWIARRAEKQQIIRTAEARSVYILMAVLLLWTLASGLLGLMGVHQQPLVRQAVPFLWQAAVPVILLLTALWFSPNLRSAAAKLAVHSPQHWLAFFQALRIGALGGVLKAVRGDISSSFLWWVGLPDFLFGLSAVIVGWLLVKKKIAGRTVAIWNLVGAAIILLPTFGFTSYFMAEPGFVFIFEFPMVLAPSIVVPMFVFFNFLAAWGVYRSKTPASKSSEKTAVRCR